MVSVDCNETSNPMPREDCNRYAILVGSYWPSPGDRNLKTQYTPPLVETGYVATRRLLNDDDDVKLKRRPIETLEAAQALNATVCLRAGENSVVENLRELYPHMNVVQRCDNHDECLALLEDPDACALYVGHELTLCYTSVQRGGLAVSYEDALPRQIITWAFHSRLDPTVQFYIQRWIYKAKESGFFGRLYNQYFNPTFCPLGKAGVNCKLPCHPAHGVSGRNGVCICDTTNWTGNDCSIEAMEDIHSIAKGAKIASFFIAINFCCSGHLWHLVVREEKPHKFRSHSHSFYGWSY